MLIRRFSAWLLVAALLTGAWHAIGNFQWTTRTGWNIFDTHYTSFVMNFQLWVSDTMALLKPFLLISAVALAFLSRRFALRIIAPLVYFAGFIVKLILDILLALGDYWENGPLELADAWYFSTAIQGMPGEVPWLVPSTLYSLSVLLVLVAVILELSARVYDPRSPREPEVSA